MSEKKPLGLRSPRTRRACPVCGKPSYSSNGTHPQCGVTRADALSRDDRLKAAAAVAKAKRKSWSKACPKCKYEVPSRRLVCDCGHEFTSVPFGVSVQ